MSTLIEFRAAVAAGLRADPRLANVVVAEHGGDWDLHELQRYATRTPAVIVSLIHVECETERGLPRADVLVNAAVLTNSKAGNAMDIGAMRIVHSLLNILCRDPRPDWGLDDLGAPEDVKALNCYNKDLDAQGVALWSVAWCQLVELSPSALVEDAFETLHATWDIAPRADGGDLGEFTEAEDEIDLT